MIAIIDYGLGNLTSVLSACGKLGFDAVVTQERSKLVDAEKLILPGVGAFGDGMRLLRERGLIEPLTRMVQAGKPFLGICLGFELVAKTSEEFGFFEGLGWVEAHVRRLAPADPSLRVPHVGWNALQQRRNSVLFRDVPDNALFYFVHSYCLQADEEDLALGTCDYGGPFVAAIEQDNIYGTQFHPEKSQRHGLTMLRNFLELG
jgi:imidazole glycerol-phosphate synthase subunit HisH